MQGNLYEIDIRSILQLIELGQRTGELYIEARSLSTQTQKYWYLFFANGHIIYAADQTNHSLLRLQDYLQPYQHQPIALEEIFQTEPTTSNIPEYSYLWSLLEKQLITPSQGRKIIEKMVEETLFDLFSLIHGSFVFEMAAPLAPQLTLLEISPLLNKTLRQIQKWKQLYPQIQHPDQYLSITHPSKLRANIPEKAYQSLNRWSEQKITLRQLFRALNRDLLAIAKVLYPYAERGWIQFITSEHSSVPPKPSSEKPLQIVCLDDDLTIGKSIEAILEPYPCQFTLMSDPRQALSQLFEIKPDLILCDIAMPILEGYEVCAMLRQSQTFRQIPIIMLTGKEGLIDRVKARMVGATDYLTKPFGANELILLLEKYTERKMSAGNHSKN